jgi:hypothetical protein
MPIIHYLDTDVWRVPCADPSRLTDGEPRLWTFVSERVTCPACLRVLAEKQGAAHRSNRHDELAWSVDSAACEPTSSARVVG